MDTINVLLRWIHVVAGILWVGFAYFFNFVLFPSITKLDRETTKKVVPEIVPRALFWARWAAVITWVAGILLLINIFYAGGLMTGESGTEEWGVWQSTVSLAVILGLAYGYDLLARSLLERIRRSSPL